MINSQLYLVFTILVLLQFSISKAVRIKNEDDLLTRSNSALPVVLWHGMGDSCCNPMSMGYIKKLIQTNISGGVYVDSLMLGNNVMEDTEHGFFANMNDHVRNVCTQLKGNPRLRNGYNAIGFSQGGLFVRALAQRCPDPPIRNLISIGGPQQGVFGLPHCPGSTPICATVRHLLDYGAYEKFVQNTIVQAQYWHDPNLNEDYRHRSIFLADLNCELQCNATYKRNLLGVQNLVLIQFLRDQMIQPKESAWFGFYAENQTGTVLQMEQTRLYQDDLIGLKTLKESGRLHLLAIDAEHLRIPTEMFISEIIQKYLLEESTLLSSEAIDDAREEENPHWERSGLEEDEE